MHQDTSIRIKLYNGLVYIRMEKVISKYTTSRLHQKNKIFFSSEPNIKILSADCSIILSLLSDGKSRYFEEGKDDMQG